MVRALFPVCEPLMILINFYIQPAIEKHLKSAVQKDLHGMKEVEKAVKEIKVGVGEVEHPYLDCSEVVRPIKEVNEHHQQVNWLLCCTTT